MDGLSARGRILRGLPTRQRIHKSPYGRDRMPLGGWVLGMPVFLDWRRAAAPDDLARQTAQALSTGAFVVLPTEAGYVLAADPTKLANPARPSGLPDSVAVSRLDGFFEPSEFFARADLTPAER